MGTLPHHGDQQDVIYEHGHPGIKDIPDASAWITPVRMDSLPPVHMEGEKAGGTEVTCRPRGGVKTPLRILTEEAP